MRGRTRGLRVIPMAAFLGAVWIVAVAQADTNQFKVGPLAQAQSDWHQVISDSTMESVPLNRTDSLLFDFSSGDFPRPPAIGLHKWRGLRQGIALAGMDAFGVTVLVSYELASVANEEKLTNAVDSLLADSGVGSKGGANEPSLILRVSGFDLGDDRYVLNIKLEVFEDRVTPKYLYRGDRFVAGATSQRVIPYYREEMWQGTTDNPEDAIHKACKQVLMWFVDDWKEHNVGLEVRDDILLERK